MFPCEYCKILKSNIFYITPPLPASVICRTFKVSRSFLGENPRKTWNEVIKSDLKKSKVSDDLAKDRFMIMKALYPSSPGDSNQINMIRRQLFFQNKIPQALTWCQKVELITPINIFKNNRILYLPVTIFREYTSILCTLVCSLKMFTGNCNHSISIFL